MVLQSQLVLDFLTHTPPCSGQPKSFHPLPTPQSPPSLSPCLSTLSPYSLYPPPHPHFIQSQPPAPPSPPRNREDILDAVGVGWGRGGGKRGSSQQLGKTLGNSRLGQVAEGQVVKMTDWWDGGTDRQTETEPHRRFVYTSIGQALPSLCVMRKSGSGRLGNGPSAYSL